MVSEDGALESSWSPLEALEQTLGAISASEQAYRPPEVLSGAAPGGTAPERPPWLDDETFEIHEILGEGGMGQVRRASQRSLRREVAVKLPQGDAPEAIDSFLSEALTTARLEHANIIPVHVLGRT